jgi:hypothetical protein
MQEYSTGKYLRETHTSAQTVVDFNLMQLLDKVPRTMRAKYGRRDRLSSEEKAALSQGRNRCHSQATRTRKRFFDEITRIKQVLIAMRQNSIAQSEALTVSTLAEHCGVQEAGHEIKQEPLSTLSLIFLGEEFSASNDDIEEPSSAFKAAKLEEEDI